MIEVHRTVARHSLRDPQWHFGFDIANRAGDWSHGDLAKVWNAQVTCQDEHGSALVRCFKAIPSYFPSLHAISLLRPDLFAVPYVKFAFSDRLLTVAFEPFSLLLLSFELAYSLSKRFAR